MKKYFSTLFLIVLIIFLSCSCGNTDSGISVSFQSLEGDKYFAKTIFEVSRNDGKPINEIEIESVRIEVDGEDPLDSQFTRLYGGEKADNVAEFLLICKSETDLSGKNAAKIIENINIDGAKFSGEWKSETMLDVDKSSLLYSINSDAACNSDDIIFESVEVTPHSMVLEMKVKTKTDHEFRNSIGIELENGERRSTGSDTSGFGTNPKDGKWEAYRLQKWWKEPININEATRLLVGDKAYSFSEIAILEK